MDGTAKDRDFLDQPRRDRRQADIGHQEYRFDPVVELLVHPRHLIFIFEIGDRAQPADDDARTLTLGKVHQQRIEADDANIARDRRDLGLHHRDAFVVVARSEEHTSELQSLMRTSYAVFCLTKNKHTREITAPTANIIKLLPSTE